MKEDLKKTPTNQVLIRFNSKEEQEALAKLKIYAEKSGGSLSSFYKKILMDWFEVKGKETSYKNIENVIFVALNKAIYARTMGINKMLLSEVRPVNFESQIISDKLNLVLNLLLQQTKVPSPQDMTPSSLKEFDIFSKSRKSFNLSNEKNLIDFDKKTSSANTSAKLYQNEKDKK